MRREKRDSRRSWLIRIPVTAVLLGALALTLIGVVYRQAPVADLRGVYAYSPIGTSQVRRTGLQEKSLVPLSEMAPCLQLAVLTNEDGDFPNHGGLDFREIRRALTDAIVRGRRLRGASTISQQLAKNVFFSKERSLRRKFLEAVYTVKLERQFSKEEIFSLYLHVAQFGPSIFGVAEAARTYFGKESKGLNLEEAALLTLLLRNPLERGPRLAVGTLNARDRIELWRILLRTQAVLDHFRDRDAPGGSVLTMVEGTSLSRLAESFQADGYSRKTRTAAAGALRAITRRGYFEERAEAP